MHNSQMSQLDFSDLNEESSFLTYCMASLSPINKAPGVPSQGEEIPQKRKAGVQSTPSCNCKKSKCLKLYCECFSANSLCGPECKCKRCQNKPRRVNLRKKAVAKVLEKNSFGFLREGCSCVKSQCQKKYCECFHQGVRCLETCKCIGCRNINNI